MADESTIIARFGSEGNNALQQFMLGLAGSSQNLKLMEQSAYAASRASTAFSRQLATEPIVTLKNFAAQTNKAAIATEYFREQLAFLAASRFGAIMIWGAIIGGITATIVGMVKATADLEKNVRFVQSAFLGSEKSLAEYNQIQDRMITGAIAFGQNYETIGKILWELKSAGLSASQAMAGLDVNQKLVVAGVSDINQATRLTAALFRVYGDSIKGATSDQEKFALIGDVLANVLNRSQVDMDGLVQGFKYAIATADLADVSFAQVSASLSVLNNRMLFGTTAGTSLVNAFVQFSENQDKIVAAFDISIDRSKTFGSQFESILTQLHDRFGESNMSMEEMGKLFESLNIRGGRAIAALIKGFDEWKKTLSDIELGKVKGDLESITDTRMDSLITQWERFKEIVKSAMAETGSGPAAPAKNLLKIINDLVEAEKRATEQGSAYAKIMNTIWAAVRPSFLDVFRDGANLTGQLVKNLKDVGAKDALPSVTAHLQELGIVGIRSFQDILSEEQKWRFSLLANNKTIDERIVKLKSQIREQEDAAVKAERQGLEEEEINKPIEKAAVLTEQLNRLEDERLRTAEKQKSEALDNLAAMEKFREVVLSIKAASPEEQIRRNVDALTAAKARLDAATVGTGEWRKATAELAKDIKTAADNYQIIDKAIDKALASQHRLNQAVIEQAQQLVTQGQGFQGEQLLRQQKETVEWQLLYVQNDEQKVKLVEQLISLSNEQLKLNAGDYQAQRQLEDLLLSKRDILAQIAGKDLEAARNAEAVWRATEETTKDFVTQAAESFKEWPTLIENASTILKNNLNAGLQETNDLLAKATKQMLAFTELLGSGTNNSIKDIEEFVRRGGE